MATHQFIYWRTDKPANEKGEVLANVHLIVGYNQGTIADFLEMAEVLRETFPQATNDKIRGGMIYKSSSYLNKTIIAWDAYIPKGDYPGWHQSENTNVEYLW